MSYSHYFHFTNRTTQSDNVHTEHRGAAHLYSGTLRTVESTPAHLYGRNSPKENRLAIWLILRSLPWPPQLHRHTEDIYLRSLQLQYTILDLFNIHAIHTLSQMRLRQTQNIRMRISSSTSHQSESIVSNLREAYLARS